MMDKFNRLLTQIEEKCDSLNKKLQKPESNNVLKLIPFELNKRIVKLKTLIGTSQQGSSKP